MLARVVIVATLCSCLAGMGCRGIVNVPKPPEPTAITVDPNTHTRVIIVVFENQEYEKIIGNANAPYLNQMANDYAIADNFYSNTHPSIGDYFMMTTGSEISNDLSFSEIIPDDNLIREAGQGGVSWKAYFESYPEPGYLEDRAFPYVKSHNPFAYFSDTHYIPQQADNLVPLTQLPLDYRQLPSFVYICPNQQNNMHDCPPSMPAGQCTNNDKLLNGDNWLRTVVGPIIGSSDFQKNGLLIIWFDESWDNDSRNGGGHVPVILVGPKVKRGYHSQTFFQHESVLRLILEQLGLPTTLGAAANAPSMNEFFQAQP